jgi:hypothetical protein
MERRLVFRAGVPHFKWLSSAVSYVGIGGCERLGRVESVPIYRGDRFQRRGRDYAERLSILFSDKLHIFRDLAGNEARVIS